MELKERFIDYCNENWRLDKFEIHKALDLMMRNRCTVGVANPTVLNHIRDLADDFARDNGLGDNWLYEEGIDEEEVFFELKK